MENNRARMVMTYVKAYAGMGSGEEVDPAKEWSIPLLDDLDETKPIVSAEEAKELLQQMLDGEY